jgi:hypothetical protein
MYAKVAFFLKSRKDFTEDKLEGLEEIVMDAGKAKAIFDASKSSMGMDISPIDLINIESFATRVIGLIDYRAKLHSYLQSKMHQVAPNLQALIGDLVGARLIAHAGSLTNLAKYPASTVQILGAEKALFRALKTRGKTPKYGLIFHSSFIGRAGAKNKGRISRYLANKCSIASRIDCFSDTPTDLFGKKLHEQVEDRLKFYETGEAPMKNADAMQAVIDEFEEMQREERKSEKAEKKKKKKQKQSEEGDEDKENLDESLKRKSEDIVEEKPKKKKKSKNEDEVVAVDGDSQDDEVMVAESEPTSEKKKKKKKSEAIEDEEPAVVEEVVAVIEEVKKSKKKKKKSEAAEEEKMEVDEVVAEEEQSKKKTKKKKNKEE